MTPRRLVLAALVLPALALLASGCGAGAAAEPPAVAVLPSSSASGPWHARVPDEPMPRPSFLLTDTSGRPYDFAAATRGRATLLFFGYANCPDVCPTTMADIASALRQVPPEVRDRVSVVFITTDPQRDSAPALRRWLDRFNPAFIGLRGTPAQVEHVERLIGVPLAEAEEVPGGGYSVSHSAQVTAYGADDRAHALYQADAQVSDYRADLPLLVEERPPA
jgi:protein SCO1/2